MERRVPGSEQMNWLRAALLAALISSCAVISSAEDRAIPLNQLRSGSEFLSPELRALQADAFANPGMLWVERGAKLWSTPAGSAGQSCASCHQDAAKTMRGVAASYPRVDAKSGFLLNVEARINQCRSERQAVAPFRYESDDLLSLTAYVNSFSKDYKINVVIDGNAETYFEAGRTLYYRRSGQMNLSCAQCHEENWGKNLYAERISQGHPNAYPAYRMEWQSMGSLERRLRACLSGVRAEMLPYGAQEYRNLALFLAWRAQGLPMESPGIRR